MYKVRPIKPSDLNKERSIEIKAVITNDNRSHGDIGTDHDVLSNVPYEIYDTSKDELVNTNLFTKSTHIRLAMPIVNIFLAGRDLDVISKIIPKEYNVQSLARGGAVLFLSSNEEGDPYTKLPNSIDNTNVYDKYKHLIGGSAIKYLLDKVDIEDAIKQYLVGISSTVLSSRLIKNLPNERIGDIVRGNGDVWIIDEYYLNVSDYSILDRMNQKAGDIRNKLLLGDDLKGEFIPKIIALLSFRDDPNKFKDMVQEVIPVIPLGYRPTIDGRHDPLSILYNKLIQSNNSLKNGLLTNGSRLNDVRLKYIDMYNKYENLVYKKNIYDEDKFEPLIKILTGKEGVIRKHVQSSTIDQSARSVITVDPHMSVDTIGVPEDMALSLCELDAIEEFDHSSKNKSIAMEQRYRSTMLKKAKSILDGSYIIAGRQPTLYRLGVQAFKVEIVKGYSIRLNPISTPSFNADFDGDQMYLNKPQSFKAQEEARILMSNINNVFLPRDGSCHLAPRQEMIYGLYLCYNAKSDIGARTIEYDDNNEFIRNIIEDLEMQNVMLDDKCIVNGVEYRTIGYAALKILLGGEGLQRTRLGVIPITQDEGKEERCVTESFFKEYFKHLKLNFATNTFILIVNRFVELGFTIANLYAPDINVLEQVDTSDLKEEFDEIIKAREEMHNLGFDTEESFSLYHASEYNKLKDRVMKRIKETLGEDNGFIQLIESGARGSESNLLQLFGMKGTPMKNQAESFNAVIKTPLSEQLPGLEHFITAYGSREGVIDKVIGTYAPGYLSRKMTHVSRHLSIETEDCGTENGIHLTYDFLVKMYGVSNLTGRPEVDYYTIKDYASKIMETRFIVGGGVTPLTAHEAEMVFSSMIATTEGEDVKDLGGVKLRSPITCEDQCCIKCYGIDMTTNKMVVKGTPIGLIAGPTVGEPVTQLIMKNFQRGGVAGVRNLTSSFDTLSDLLEMHSVSKRKEGARTPIIHDFISPEEGSIETISNGDGTARLQIIYEGKNKLRQTVNVYEAVKLKKYVKVGESIQEEEGTLDINEILKIRGVDEAQMFMLFSAYNIFANEIFVNFKHFEVIVNGMTLHVCTKGNDYFKVGRYYSIKEYTLNNKEGAEFLRVIRGLKQIAKVRNDFLTSIYLEDVNAAVKRNMVVSGEDELKDPFVRITLGMDLGVGSDVEGYVDMRGV